MYVELAAFISHEPGYLYRLAILQFPEYRPSFCRFFTKFRAEVIRPAVFSAYCLDLTF